MNTDLLYKRDSFNCEEKNESKFEDKAIEDRINLWLDENRIFISDGKGKSLRIKFNPIVLKRKTSDLLEKRKLSTLNLKLDLLND